MSNGELASCFRDVVKEVAKRIENDRTFRTFPKESSPTINEVMLAVTDMLHAVDVQVFELSMWQAFTGRTSWRMPPQAGLKDQGAEG
jgi:hypothetical protein